MLDLIIQSLYDCGVTWLAAAPTCPKCGGEGIRTEKQPGGNQRSHCRECCSEWVSSRFDV